jgi:maleylpyruvate isomerase
MMRLYGYFRSSSAYRTRIALNLKGLSYELIPIHLRRNGGEQKRPDYLRINPQGLVPVIDSDGFLLSQSLAIIEWLDESYPEIPLVPADANVRAQVRAFSQIIACDIHPLQNLRVLEYLKNEFGQGQEAVDRWCQRWIDDGLRACEAFLAERPLTTYAFGATPTLADICLVPQVFSAQRFGVALDSMPRVVSVFEACSKLEAFAKAHPSRQPDAE